MGAHHSWTKVGYNQAKCKNGGCGWHRQVEKFDGHHVTIYLHPDGRKQYHAPDCGPSKKSDIDEVYSIHDVQKEQLKLELFKKSFISAIKTENIRLLISCL